VTLSSAIIAILLALIGLFEIIVLTKLISNKYLIKNFLVYWSNMEVQQE